MLLIDTLKRGILLEHGKDLSQSIAELYLGIAGIFQGYGICGLSGCNLNLSGFLKKRVSIKYNSA